EITLLQQMPAVHDLCAAQLRSISVPDKKMNLASLPYRECFISSVTRGDHRGPDKEFVRAKHTGEYRAMCRLWLELKYR
ncbi:5373_t:CDS:1, partial [Paraglomus brasilianum]